MDSLSSTSALLLSLASSNLGTTRGERVFVVVPEIQNNGISIKLYPGKNLQKIEKENVVLSGDSKARLKKCLNVLRWMDVKPLSKVSAGHKMDGHKNCQKCLQVMRWMDTNIVKSVCRS